MKAILLSYGFAPQGCIQNAGAILECLKAKSSSLKRSHYNFVTDLFLALRAQKALLWPALGLIKNK